MPLALALLLIALAFLAGGLAATWAWSFVVLASSRKGED